MQTKIIAVVGMSGSGKSEAIQFIKERGVPDIYFGGMIYREMDRRNVEKSPENQQIYRRQLRDEMGDDFIAELASEEADNLIAAGQKRILFDGLYSWSEFRYLKHHFPGVLTVVAIVAPRALRYTRLTHRPERPFTKEQAEARDISEIEQIEKGGPIAMADYYVQNDSTLENLHQQLQKILTELEF
ncbi:MAG: AAA family ATPase [Candidatus Nomurabacteria bacterium]|jgi:dephospho-CoA kinase|nr:AAA family ATPase [Candidatus Nomurabacteria bacterium]